jgi:outer membrane protein TolC
MKIKTLKTPRIWKCWPVIALVFSTSVSAQTILDDYVKEGLQSNLVLKQKHLTLEQAQQSLRIARSYYMPSVSLLADYISGIGGRNIALPIGDLLNPVYRSLNQLTQSDDFSEIENVEQTFFPQNQYDARIRTSVSLFNTDLYLNKSIQGQQVQMKQYELDAYKRQLVYEIKSAYFIYLGTVSAASIYEAGLNLVTRNVEINESLVRNGKSLPANYLRSKSEAARVKAELNSATNRVSNARQYFNFFLNRDLEAEIDSDFRAADFLLETDTLGTGTDRREELKMLRTAREIGENTLRLHKMAHVPKLSAFLDLGSQASNWQFNEQSKYYLVGVQLTVPIFQGFRNSAAVRQSGMEISKTELALSHTALQLRMSAQVARNELQTAAENYRAAQEQHASAQSYFKLVDKGYQQGVNSLIEFLDARNQLTASELQQNLRLYEMLTAFARLERETASYTL